MKVVFDDSFFDEIDHFHPNFDESEPNRWRQFRIGEDSRSVCFECKRFVGHGATVSWIVNEMVLSKTGEAGGRS